MCRLCKTKPVYEFTNKRKLCKICFIKYFQKKVLYTIRKFEMVKSNDVIGYFGTHQVGLKEGCTPKNIQKNIFTKDKDFRDVVLEDVLKMFVKKTMVELIELPTNTPRVYTKEVRVPLRGPEKKLNKIAIPSTIDSEANEIIGTLIQGHVKDLKNLKPVNGKIIKPLYLFLDEEVLLYAKLKKLKFSKVKKSVEKISIFIDELEKKHPEVKRAVVNSHLGLC